MIQRIARLAACIACASLWAGAGDATVRHEDLDGDGQAEIILANDFLQVELLTGIPPAEPRPGWRERLPLAAKKPVAPSRYGKRFVWAGWVRNIESVPSGRRWFVDTTQGSETWLGIPEEFEQTVKMAEMEDGSFACLKVGIGEATGSGMCLGGSLKLTKAIPYVHEATVADDGAAVATFTQTVETDYGYGYVYRKEFRLVPGSAVLEVIRTLRNTGIQPLRTSWFTHGFWGQAGNGHDRECWSTVPLQDLAGGIGAVDTAPCRVSDLAPTCYWGPISAEELAEPWYASGYSPTREVFVSSFSERLAWIRIWTHAKTYSVEPFVLIDLAPGESKIWTDRRAAVRGLDGAAAVGQGAVLDLGGTDEKLLHATICTYRPLKDVQVRLRCRPEGADEDMVDHTATLATCGPDWPGLLRLERRRFPEGPCLFQITATCQGEILLETSRRIMPRTAGLPPAWLGAAKGKRAVVLADTKRVEDAVKPTPATVYWATALERAGFAVSVLPVGEAGAADALADAQLAVVSGPVRVPAAAVRALVRFVSQGGGLVVTGPLDLRAFELTDLLPVTAVMADVAVQASAPRDGTREFLEAYRQRYQLELRAPHPAVADLPLYPAALQGIARLQVVEPRAGAETILTYTGLGNLKPEISSPALVVGTHGQGRVAVFASPANWGTPQHWCIWNRIGEYHQQFLGQLGQWAAGTTIEANDK